MLLTLIIPVKVATIQVDLIRDGYTEVTSGLKAGQKIVIVGANKLSDGMKN